MRQATVRVFPGEILSDIDPMVFGNFIEFTHDCINEGMWAELLGNRGFEDRAEGDLIAPRWREAGYNDTGLYALEAETPFGHGLCQRIENVHHFGGYRGIAQHGLYLEAGATYRLSLWARAERAQGLLARLVDDRGRALWERRLPLSGEWRRQEISGIAPGEARHAALVLALEEEGVLRLDQCSLMPEDAVDGIWRRVYDMAKASRPTVLRFPGGCFADCYDWREGVGPRDARPARPNAHWGGMEENNFGTDEFLKLCESLDTLPMICVNFGSADEAEAAAWVEYCNGGPDTPMGRLRAVHGHPAPYNISLWGIGNETWADWEIGRLTAEEYGARYSRFSRAMRAASPIPLRLIACGGDGNSTSQDWNRRVLTDIGRDAEYLDLHFYAPQLYEQPATPRQIYDATVYAGHKYEAILQEAAGIIAELGIETRLMAGEYNAMYYNHSNREHTLEAALLNAGFLNAFLRNAEAVRIGIFSDLVNGWQGGCIRSRQGACYGTPSYYALRLYAEALPDRAVRAEADCDTHAIEGAGHVPPMAGLPGLDHAATLNGEGALCLFLVNRDPEEALQVRAEVPGWSLAELREIAGPHPYSKNDFGDEQIAIRSRAPGPEGITLPPHSLCLAIFHEDKETHV